MEEGSAGGVSGAAGDAMLAVEGGFEDLGEGAGCRWPGH